MAKGNKGLKEAYGVERLSPREQQILSFISENITKNGYPPSVREIGTAVGLVSPSSVHAHLRNLERKGYLRREEGKTRAMEVTYQPLQAPKVHNYPVLGRVAAGEPILAQQNIEGYFPLPEDFVEGDAFLLQVRGESMLGAGILPGDYVVVRRQKEVENGAIAVLLLDNEATVKRFYREKNQIRLQPENPAFDPIIVREVEILGRVVGVIRRI